MKLRADDFKDLPDIPQLKTVDENLPTPVTQDMPKEKALEEARKVAEMVGRKIDEIDEMDMRQLPVDIEEILLLAAHLSAAVEML